MSGPIFQILLGTIPTKSGTYCFSIQERHPIRISTTCIMRYVTRRYLRSANWITCKHFRMRSFRREAYMRTGKRASIALWSLMWVSEGAIAILLIVNGSRASLYGMDQPLLWRMKAWGALLLL